LHQNAVELWTKMELSAANNVANVNKLSTRSSMQLALL